MQFCDGWASARPRIVGPALRSSNGLNNQGEALGQLVAGAAVEPHTRAVLAGEGASKTNRAASKEAISPMAVNASPKHCLQGSA
jgi:hypothetical protein